MASLIDSLIPLLEQDATQLTSLEQILKEERAALESRDNSALQAAVERKAQTVQAVQNNAQTKSRLFAQHGLPVSPQHIKAALTRLKRDDVLQLWEQVKAQLYRKSTRLNSSHVKISYAVFCLKKKKKCQTA